MISEKQYNGLISFAKAYFSIAKKSHIYYQDVVNDVLLKFLEGDAPFTIQQVESAIKHHNDVLQKTVKKVGNNFNKQFTEKICKTCKELLPVAFFYLHKHKPHHRNGEKMIVASNCKTCSVRKKTQWDRDNRGRATEVFKKWHSKNKNKWNEYNRKRMRDEKEKLTDAYIRKCLCNKYASAFLKLPENYHIIQSYREKKLVERMEKKRNRIKQKAG